jgi:hypothetical protein
MSGGADQENMSSWAHARTPHAHALVQFRADQARHVPTSCGTPVRRSLGLTGCPLESAKSQLLGQEAVAL